MEVITLPIYNTEGKEIDLMKLDSTVFNGTVNRHAIYQAVLAYNAARRKGLASTKTMGEVSGGGRKPWRQKGTGRARVGSIRSPLWRHGGVIFGPHPREFSYSLPTKIKRLALKSCLNAKINENNFIILDSLKLETPKTKEAVKVFSNLKMCSSKIKTPKPATSAKAGITAKLKTNKRQKPYKILLLLEKIDGQIKLALRNIDFLSINLAQDTYAYEILTAHKLIITKDGLRALTERLKK